MWLRQAFVGWATALRFLAAVLLATATVASYGCTDEEEVWTCIVTSRAIAAGSATGTGTGSTQSGALREAELDACDKLGISELDCFSGGNIAEDCQYSGGGSPTAPSPQ